MDDGISQDLRALIEGALASETQEAVVLRIRDGLCHLIRQGAIPLTDDLLEADPGHYARRLLHRDPDQGYSVVAMTWAPGQGTPLHDHAGLWCVEGVLHGEIAVTRYELEETDGDRYRFRRMECEDAGVGTAGCLIPPSEYHVIENADPEETAVTLHVYGGDMETCNAYQPESGDWYRRERKEMGFDA